MTSIESYSKIIKRKDPKTVILPTYVLLALSVIAGLFVPLAWLDAGPALSYLINISVFGAAIFFFANDKSRWKGTAVVLCLAVIIIEILVFIRFACQYNILFISTPQHTIAEVFSGQSAVNIFARNILYKLILIFILTTASQLKFTGRTRWWIIVVFSSLSVLICQLIYFVPALISAPDFATQISFLREISEHVVQAVIIFVSAILFDWRCSFSDKPLRLKTGALVWMLFGAVISAGAAGYAGFLFITSGNVELIAFALISMLAYTLLLTGNRSGITVMIYGVFLFIAYSLSTYSLRYDTDLIITSFGFVLSPVFTWLIVKNSWKVTSSPDKSGAAKRADSAKQKSAAVQTSSAQHNDAAEHNRAALSVTQQFMPPSGVDLAEYSAQQIGRSRLTSEGEQDIQLLYSAADAEAQNAEEQKKSAKKQKLDKKQIYREQPDEQPQTSEALSTILCEQCGFELPGDARFCVMCGKKCGTDPAEIDELKRIEELSEIQAPQISGEINYVQSDNKGTMQSSLDEATSYWVMRRPNMKNKPPFLLYTFSSEQAAVQALLDIPFIHIAADTGSLICDHLMEYGYYKVADENDMSFYEAVVCGHDLVLERYQIAKAAFEHHGGIIKNEQIPTETLNLEQASDLDQVMFKEEFIDNDKYKYRVFYAPNKVTAIDFLSLNPVNEVFFYLVVDTPEGTFGRDIDGMYEV